MKIAVAGTGYVGLSIATLLSQNNEVVALDIIPEKVEMINKGISPIKDEYIEDYLKNKKLNLRATLDYKDAFKDAEFIVISTPTNYDDEKNFFDTSSVEDIIQKVISMNIETTMVVKSTIPVGFIEEMKKKYNIDNIMFSPEFLREGRALYDNLYPSRIIVGEKSQRAEKFAELLKEAAINAGAPENCILWIPEPSVTATRLLMNHPGVDLILATGGTGMVKSAYSCGKPALGVGPGNVPCVIEKSAKLKTSVNDLVMSKSFDNGMICASEQSVLVEKEIYQEFEELMKKAGCYFVNPEEKEKLKNAMFDWNDETGFKLKSFIPGQSPYQIAKQAGFEVPEDTKVIVVYEEGIGRDYPFSKEKLSPVLTYYIVNDYEEALDKAERLLEFGGLGHTAVIHSEDREKILEFSEKMKAGRIIVNSPSTHGGIGDIYNTNMPSLTLGCGSFGGNSTTANVSSVNLINIKRVARRRVNMQWFKVPEKIYFEAGSIAYLEKMPDIERAFIVTDPGMVKFGYVDKILYHIRKRANHVHCEIFSEIED